MLSAIGRAAVRRVAAGQQSTNRSYHGIRQLERATFSKGGLAQRFSVLLMYRRSYATTTKVASKPKSTTATKAKAPAKPKSKATPAKKPTKATKKKPVTKKKKKVAAKPKKPVKKKLVKKVLTPEQIKSAHIRALKKSVLKAPKLKPAQSWLVYVVEESKKTAGAGGPSLTKTLASSYKNLSPAELESLNHTANQNKAENEITLKKWVESYTPREIKDANNARQLLKSKYKVGTYSKIHDTRIPKQPTSPWGFFLKDRHASGDMKNINGTEAFKLVSQEWNALPDSDKKAYLDRATADQQRYAQESLTVMPPKK